MNQYLVTKPQLENLFFAWGVTEKPPGKGKQVLVCFAPGRQFRLATVAKTVAKASYGSCLFSVTLS